MVGSAGFCALTAALISLAIAVPVAADDEIEKGGRVTDPPFSKTIPVIQPSAVITPRCGDIKRMVAGPDDALWLRGGAAGRVCRVTGARVEQVAFRPPGGPSYGSSLVVGADGRPWFEYYRPGQIGRAFVHLAAGVGRVNPDLSVTDFPLPKALTDRGIAVGGLYPGVGSLLSLPAQLQDTSTVKARGTKVVIPIARDGALGTPEPYVDPFAGLTGRRIAADGPGGTMWAASPSQRLILRAATRGLPSRRYRAPRELAAATWLAVGPRQRIWFGNNRRATSWHPRGKPRTLRIPQHPGLTPGPSSVLADGRLVLGFRWRTGRDRARPTVFILSRDGSRKRLDLQGQLPWTILQVGQQLWIGGDRDLLRFAP